MSDFSVSQISISKTRAIEMANAKLDYIEKYRAERRKSYITREMNDRNNSFWRKLTGKFLTYEETEKELEGLGPDSDLWWIGYGHIDAEHLCHAVLTAAKLTDSDQLTLTFKDAGMLT